ncbi:MAG: FHA domain-containing protein [Chromatiales bacterium]|nr:FHA domain-containing protein [Chromatiales bacterium]
MGVLDELKQRAEQLKAEEARAAEQQAERLAQARDVLSPTLARLHAYLAELVQQLEVVQPKVPVDFRIRDVGVLEGLLQGGYRVSRDGDAQSTQRVSFSCLLESRRHYRFELSIPGQVDNWLTQLRAQGLKVDHAQVLEENSIGHRVWINIAGHVPVRLRFEADIGNESILLLIQNYEEMGESRHRIRPEQIDEAFFDELGRYILRKPNRFLKLEVPAEVRDRLRRRIEEDQKRKRDELGGPVGALSARIRSLFKRHYVLQLRLGDKTIRTDDQADGLVLGRGDNCDLVVNASHVSRRHARIEWRMGDFVLIDESRNGTYVTTPERENVHLRRDEIVLVGSGIISLGAPIGADSEHLIHYSV